MLRMMLCGGLIGAIVGGCSLPVPPPADDDIVLDNARFSLRIGSDARVKSLVVKETGEECIDAREGIVLFSTTQDRPFNNEVKLANPNKRTTYQANRLRQEGDRLVVGFMTAPYEAVIRVRNTNGYIAFTLEDFISDKIQEKQYRHLCMDVPPVARFRVAQLPVRNRTYFGDWLNVSWDERAAVAVVGCEPLVDVDHENRFGFRLLNADLERGLKLRGGTAAIVVGAGRESFLDAMAQMEEDFNLPRGVASRRQSLINASIYWSANVTPANVDEHIALAKRGGFRMMLMYYTTFTGDFGYSTIDYYQPDTKRWPNGYAQITEVLNRIKAAGITPGLHCLQTHIGLKGRYVTPVADARLNHTRMFSLARELPENGAKCEVFVNENPVDAMRDKKCRILQFGGELIAYEGYTTEPPYRFTGCTRGYCKTLFAAHPKGEIGGVLDVSEFGATSCYVDQRTTLQDEVGKNIAKLYDCGFSFCYFDGSEGVNPPCGINVPYAQYRVTRQFKKQPLFTEGAAKGHFGWHIQAGANAFDIFPPEVFKAKIVEYPQAEASIMRQDMTRLDFGWWGVWLPGKTTVGVQSDMWEWGTSRAAAWDCPATIQVPLSLRKHPRCEDLLEVMRRWEDVRARNLLTPEWKEALKSSTQEHHLLLNGKGEYEIVEISEIPNVAEGKVRAFLFTRNDKRVVTLWHAYGQGQLTLPLTGGITKDVDGVCKHVESGKPFMLSDRVYLETDASEACVRSAFQKAVLQ